MFEVVKHINSGKVFHRITANRLVLDFDDEREVEMLYSGTNNMGVRLIGSRISTEADGGAWYFHITVGERDHLAFIRREISLREVMQNSEWIHVVHYGAEGEESFHSLLPFEQIPEEYKPRNRSLCPKRAYASSLVYTSSLKGQKADLFMATPESVRAMSNGITSMLLASTDFMEKHLHVHRDVFLEGGHAIAASYRLDFRIEFDTSNQLFVRNQQKVADYLKHLMDYVLVGVTKDGIPDEDSPTEGMAALEVELMDIYRSVSDVYPTLLSPSSNRREVFRAIEGALLGIKSIGASNNYDYIEFGNKNSDEVSVPMAIIDSDFITNFASQVDQDEVEEIERQVYVEGEPVLYTIEVESFAAKSGKGAGVVHLGPSIKAGIKISATGQKRYDHTPFTESLHLKRAISVRGRATRENDVIRSISFDASSWKA